MAEKRLIDADKLIDFIDVGHLRHPGELCYSEVDVANLLLHAPTVDAVEVVRCKDCKHYHAVITNEKTGELGDWGICDQPWRNEDYDVNETDYCSSAEPKEPK